MQTDTPPPSRRRAWRLILCIFLALFALLLLAAGGGAWWLWGWRAGGLSFHESWNEKQRQEMLALAEDVRGLQKGALAAYPAASSLVKHPAPEFITLTADYLSAALAAKLVGEPIMSALKQLAKTGDAKQNPGEAGMVAWAACRSLHLGLARDLILRGADANASLSMKVGDSPAWLASALKLNDFPIRPGAIEGESCFQAAIHGKAFFSEHCAPLAERLALLEFMLEHGADIAHHKHFSILCALLSDSGSQPDRGAALEWMLDHGLTIETMDDVENAGLLLAHEGTLPAFKRIVQKKQFPLDPESKARLLHRIATSPMADSEQKILWALDELGADPNFTMSFKEVREDANGQPIIINRPDKPLIEKMTNYLDFYNEAEAAISRRMIDILHDHGITPPEERPAH